MEAIRPDNPDDRLTEDDPRFEVGPGAEDAPPPLPTTEPWRPWATYTLLGLNVAVFLFLTLAGGATDSSVLMRFGAQTSYAVWSGDWWRLITPLFLHAGLTHLAFNMWALYSLGPFVERFFGRARFLAIYLAAGLFGNVLFLLVGNPFVLSVGASGAIFGLFGALVVFGLMNRRHLRTEFWRSVLVPIAINLAYGLVAPGINNWAHLGGLAGGLAAAAAMGLPARRPVLPRWAGPALAILLLVLTIEGVRPPGWFVAFNHGVNLAHADRWQEAVPAFEEAVAGKPDWAIAHLDLGLAYAHSGRRGDAAAALQRALSLDPGLTPARDALKEVQGP